MNIGYNSSFSQITDMSESLNKFDCIVLSCTQRKTAILSVKGASVRIILLSFQPSGNFDISMLPLFIQLYK